MSDQILDEAAIDKLRVLGGDEFVQEALDTFIETATNLVADATIALSTGDLDVIIRAGHTLKGSSGNVGAAEVRQRAIWLEQAGRTGDMELVKELVQALGDSVTRLEDHVSAR